jgi:hypothetical protein
MKKVLLAGFLLSASTVCILPAFATPKPQQQVSMGLPKPVADAFARLEAQYAADGYILTNIQWTRSQNKHTATFLIADLNSDSIQDGTATWLASGQRVTTASTPE